MIIEEGRSDVGPFSLAAPARKGGRAIR